MITINKASQRRGFGNPNFQIKSVSPGINLGDPTDFGLFQLGRLDHTIIKPGTVVRMHPHKNDEILSYIRKGKMMHEDSSGNTGEIDNMSLMMMNSGSGIFHEETVPEDGEEVEMIQIFIRPEKDDLLPEVQFHQLETLYSENHWRFIGGDATTNAPLQINSSIKVYDARITEEIEVKVEEGKVALLYIFEGEIKIKDITLKKGDSVVFDEELIRVFPIMSSDLVLFIMDRKAAFSRSGKFSGMK